MGAYISVWCEEGGSMSVKHLTIHKINDDYGDLHREVVTDDDGGKELYYVCNLCDCPEDAVIWRDLVSASEWIQAVRYGIGLAEQGFTSIEVSTVEEKDEW